MTIGLRLSHHDKNFNFSARLHGGSLAVCFWGSGFIRVLKKYSEEYKLTVVREIERCGSVTAVERTIGIQRSLLYRWYKKLRGPAWGPAQRSGEARSGGGEGVAAGSVLRPWKRFDDEFKIAAVREVESGKSVAEVARLLELDKATVYNWHKQFSSRVKQTSAAETETVEELQARLLEQEQTRKREAEQRGNEEREERARIAGIIADPLIWLQNHTQTRDSHWREAKAKSPYRPFPDKPYFRPLMEALQREPTLFIEKSRDMMISWLFAGLFTHTAMTTEGIEILFQSQKEDKAFELVGYAKTLYERQAPELRKAYPLAKSLRQMADGELEFANGSRIIGIPGGGDQIRSYHPWGLFMDEAAFMPEAGEAYDHAVPVCQKIVVVSSAGPRWFADFVGS